MNPIARRHAREYALQAMYQWQLSETPLHELEARFISHHIKKKIDVDYFKELIHEIPKNIDILDKAITPFLSRPLPELDPIELVILRLGTFELTLRPDIPYRVAINESLELAKKFGSIEGFKFVNGVLDQVAKKYRNVEITAHKGKDKHA
jgi:N utilization substance protein B